MRSSRLHVYALIALAGSALLQTGCNSRGMYEGIQQQEAVRNPPPTGQPAQRKPTYDEYDAERRKQSLPPAGY